MDSRVRIMKSKNELKKLDPGSTDVLAADIFIKYSSRNAKINDWCSADFAALYKDSKAKSDDDAEKSESWSREHESSAMSDFP